MKHIKKEKICPICGKTFTASRKRRKYCSDKCATDGRKIIQKRYYKRKFDDSEFREKRIANTRKWQINNKDAWNKYQQDYNKRIS